MCGILGILPSADAALFDSALDTLVHRGPDDRGLWEAEGQICLGHRRLSILDLSAEGHQPMVSASGRFVIVFNGEIYNFLEIREKLEAKGCQFRSQSDTEVLLQAFEQWGEKCLDCLNGMWALAIWDRHEQQLFLARDRFGKKPLFYAFTPAGFVFASEMKAIYPFLPEVKPSADFSWMAKNLMDYEATQKCLVDGIQRFPAGHLGHFRKGRLSLHRYWTTLDHLPEIPASYADQVEQFRALFLDACRLRMRSDVPIGTALSGGLDSSSTLAAMAHIDRTSPGMRVSSDWRHAFVAAFPGLSLDESDFARQVVEHLGIDATFVTVDPTRDLDKLEDALYLFEELYLTSPVPMMQLYRSVRDRGVRVTLDGHGADELLSGYGSSVLEALPEAGIWPGRIGTILATHRNYFPANTFQPERETQAWLVYARFMARRFAKKLLRRGMAAQDSAHPRFSELGSFNRHLYRLTHETVLPTLLRNYDRYAMASGTEIRMPFLDYRLVCYAMALPWESKVRFGLSKAVLRDAMAPFLPPAVVQRPFKIGFNTPIVEWLRGPWKQFILDHLHSRGFRECSLINPVEVASQVQRAMDCDPPSFQLAEKAWTIMTPYFWERSLKRRGSA
ncbi:asparagine synthase (glutamine-hydrolyzing) [Trichloromonas sp.]|uniref:asparagine synthase (glutamine-hydrolyzing) n=1 Tax=Trichloromonas sp. TaxID=3069249 RepID=UPI003D819409